MKADILVESLGTIITANPRTKRGKRWMRRACGWCAGSLDFEHRCGVDMIVGALTDRLSVQDVRSGAMGKLP